MLRQRSCRACTFSPSTTIRSSAEPDHPLTICVPCEKACSKFFSCRRPAAFPMPTNATKVRTSPPQIARTSSAVIRFLPRAASGGSNARKGVGARGRGAQVVVRAAHQLLQVVLERCVGGERPVGVGAKWVLAFGLLQGEYRAEHLLRDLKVVLGDILQRQKGQQRLVGVDRPALHLRRARGRRRASRAAGRAEEGRRTPCSRGSSTAVRRGQRGARALYAVSLGIVMQSCSDVTCVSLSAALSASHAMSFLMACGAPAR